jgi:hypothetical protein
MYVALHGRNIPGAPTLTEAKVRAALQRLPPSMTYLRIVGRPDSILIAASDTTTEENVRRAVSGALDCRCVAISTSLASRIVDGAVATLRALGAPITPPYRITTEGTEWEWCLVLASDALPAGLPDSTWLFERTTVAVAVAPLEHRALLVRKRRVNANGTRITLGSRLLDPWQEVLDANRVTVSCLTSRTLNRVEEAVGAAAHFERVSAL